MAVQRFKLPLNAARMPVISTKAPRAVFVPGLDGAPRAPSKFFGADENADFNLAQVLYAENVMPTPHGIHSVGYRQLIPPTVEADFDSIFALRDADENTVLYSPGGSKNYVRKELGGVWETFTHDEIFDPLELDPECNPADSRVTYAYVDGRTFICFSRLYSTEMETDEEEWEDPEEPEYYREDMSIMVWDTETQSLQPAGDLIANLPFPIGEIDGIASCAGFLLVYSELAVAWAAFNGEAFDYTIFANGNFTGSGVQVPEDVQGRIRAIVSLPGGFMIFTDRNCIAAHYHAQSIIAPWIFREIPGAGGIESYEQATVEGTLGRVFAYTTAGLQSISLNASEAVWSDVSDFLGGRQIERYRADEHELYQGLLNLDFYVKINTVANRYIIISYGTFPGVFSYAWVFDLSLERWGKLRMVHRDCFYYAYGALAADLTYASMGDVTYDNPDLATYEETAMQSNAIVAAQHGLAFLLQTGEVVLANWSDQNEDELHLGVAIIGRVQLSRSRNMQFNLASIEGHVNGAAFIAPSYDGATLSPAIPLVAVRTAGKYKQWGGMVDAVNFNLIVEGTFDLSTIILDGTPSGRI